MAFNLGNAVIGADSGVNQLLQTLARQQQQRQEQQQRAMQIAAMVRQQAAKGASNVSVPNLGQTPMDAFRGAGGQQQPGQGIRLPPPPGAPQQQPTGSPGPQGAQAQPSPPLPGAPQPGQLQPPPTGAPAPQGGMGQQPGGQPPGADMFSPERMSYMRDQIANAIKQKNPKLDDATVSEAVDDWLESTAKLRQMTQGAQQIEERVITGGERMAQSEYTQGHEDYRKDLGIAEQKYQHDTPSGSTEANVAERDKALKQQADQFDRRLSQDDAHFRTREANVDRRLREKAASDPKITSAQRMAIARAKQARQTVNDQIQNYRQAHNGVVDPSDPQWAKMSKALDAANANLDKVYDAVESGPSNSNNAPPANANKGSDGNYYVPDPTRPGKFLMWTPPGG